MARCLGGLERLQESFHHRCGEHAGQLPLPLGTRHTHYGRRLVEHVNGQESQRTQRLSDVAVRAPGLDEREKPLAQLSGERHYVWRAVTKTGM